MKKLVVDEPVLSNPRYVQELIEKVIREKVLPHITEISRLNRELEEKRNKLKGIKERISAIRKEVDSLRARIDELDGSKTAYTIIGVLLILSSFAIGATFSAAGLVLGPLFFLGGLFTLGRSSNIGEEIEKARRRIEDRESELRRLYKELKDAEEKIKELERKVDEYKPPRVKIRRSRIYVPLLLKKVSGNKFIAVTPWPSRKSLEIPVIVEEQSLEEGIKRLGEGEEVYIDGAIREKDVGIKVIRAFKEAGLWDKISSQKAPETVLRESAAEAKSIIEDAITLSTVQVPYIELGEEDVELIKEALKKARPLKERLEGEGEGNVLESAQRLSELLRIASSLEDMKRYLSQAELFLQKKELYEDLADKVLKKLLEDTMPIDREYYEAIHSELFCRRCAENGIRKYRSAVDFQAWVFNHVLAGVDRDPDIVYPPPIIEDFVKSKWEDFLRKTYYALKLPGIRENASLDELRERYEHEVAKIAALVAGADEEVELHYTSPFTPPVLTCRRCGSQFTVDEALKMHGLERSIYKGYLALFNEFVDYFADKTVTQRKSIADARRSKDERKTMAGIYEQTYHMYRLKQLEVESELMRSKFNIEELEKTLEPSIEKKSMELEILGAKGLEKIGKLLKKMFI